MQPSKVHARDLLLPARIQPLQIHQHHLGKEPSQDKTMGTFHSPARTRPEPLNDKLLQQPQKTNMERVHLLDEMWEQIID